MFYGETTKLNWKILNPLDPNDLSVLKLMVEPGTSGAYLISDNMDMFADNVPDKILDDVMVRLELIRNPMFFITRNLRRYVDTIPKWTRKNKWYGIFHDGSDDHDIAVLYGLEELANFENVRFYAWIRTHKEFPLYKIPFTFCSWILIQSAVVDDKKILPDPKKLERFIFDLKVMNPKCKIFICDDVFTDMDYGQFIQYRELLDELKPTKRTKVKMLKLF